MKLSVIVPTLDGKVPQGLREQVAGRDGVQLVVVTGVSPVGRARNEGLRRATGEWIAWVDADDEVTADWLGAILAALADGGDVVTLDAELVGWKGRTDCVWGVPPEKVTAARLLEDVYRDLRRPSWLCLYVTRRAFWNGTAFDETVRVGEDYLLLPHVLRRASSCRYVPKRLYRYIRSDASVSGTQTPERQSAQIDLWERRLAECPPTYAPACRFGLCVSAYWVCCLHALAAGVEDSQARANAARCRRIVLRSLPALLRETTCARTLPLRVRLSWLGRFLSAAAGFWLPQRMRHRTA